MDSHFFHITIDFVSVVTPVAFAFLSFACCVLQWKQESIPWIPFSLAERERGRWVDAASDKEDTSTQLFLFYGHFFPMENATKNAIETVHSVPVVVILLRCMVCHMILSMVAQTDISPLSMIFTLCVGLRPYSSTINISVCCSHWGCWRLWCFLGELVIAWLTLLEAIRVCSFSGGCREKEEKLPREESPPLPCGIFLAVAGNGREAKEWELPPPPLANGVKKPLTCSVENNKEECTNTNTPCSKRALGKN